MRLFVAVIALALGASACTKSKAEPVEAKPASEEHADEPAHEELPRKVRLSAEVARAAHVETAPVGKEVLAVTLALPGEIAADPDRLARISTPVAGRIEQVDFREGSFVKKGDQLVTVRVPELGKVRSAFTATAAKARAARSNAERLKILLEQRLTSEQAYLDAAATADSLDAEAKGLGEQLAAMGVGSGGSGNAPFQLTLRAPLAGVVLSRDAVAGQPVTVEQVLGSIADLSEVWFLGRVFEKDLGRLRAGASVEVQLNAYPDERFVGVVDYVGRQIDPVARTLTARVRLTNRVDLLRVGLFGTARVSTTEEHTKGPVLAVPRSALTEVAGKTTVFVRQPDGDFEVHEITLGHAAAGKVEVVSGLREGEQVVVNGAFTLKSIVLKGTMAEDD